MSYKLPDKIFGIEVEGAYERYLKKLEEKPKADPAIIVPPSSIQDPDKYIILPGAKHGSYEYPDILVPIERAHLNENWNNAHASLKQEDSLMLTIRQFADLLNLLKSGNAFYGNGRRIDSQRLTQMLNDIMEVRNPWRAEHLDAKFGKNTIMYHKINQNGSIQEVTEPLEECLMQDKTPGIDLGSWLNNATNQGLPKRSTANGSLYYWAPRDGRVAGFVADSYCAILDCCGNPRGSLAALGVRAAKIKR